MAQVSASQLREGMEVHSGEGQSLGTIERLDRDSITVRGQQYEFTSIARIEGNRVHLTRQVGASVDSGRTRGASAGAAAGARDQGEIRVPQVEERLGVEKRQVETGEVSVHKTVREERQTVPVELEREEVSVDRREVRERRLAPGETEAAFEEDTIRVPVRGEEAVVTKEAVVTGEVVLDKERTTEQYELGDTVRRTHVEVDDGQPRGRPGT
jgi:uncharacterized protein (TIGR02271 family)